MSIRKYKICIVSNSNNNGCSQAGETRKAGPKLHSNKEEGKL